MGTRPTRRESPDWFLAVMMGCGGAAQAIGLLAVSTAWWSVTAATLLFWPCAFVSGGIGLWIWGWLCAEAEGYPSQGEVSPGGHRSEPLRLSAYVEQMEAELSPDGRTALERLRNHYAERSLRPKDTSRDE